MMKITGILLTFVGTLLPVLVAVLVNRQIEGLVGLLGVVAVTAMVSWLNLKRQEFFILMGIIVLVMGALIAAAVLVHGSMALWALVCCFLITLVVEP